MSLIKQIAREARDAFTQGITVNDFTGRFDNLVNSVGQLEASNVNLEDSLSHASTDIEQSSACFNIDVFSSETFAICVYILSSDKHFLLDDTPGRYSILKVIKGSVKISTYTAVADDNANIAVPEDVRAWAKKTQGNNAVPVIPVKKEKETYLDFCNAPFILRPGEAGNIHVICAIGNQAAFIKVLAPPYDMVNRACRLYKPVRTAEEDAAINTWLDKSDPNMFIFSTLPYCGQEIEF